MERSKNLLMVADLDNIHTFNIAKYVMLSTGYKLTFYNIGGQLSSIKKAYLDFYSQNGIDLYGGADVVKDGALKHSRDLFKTLNKLGTFDYMNLQYVSHYAAPILWILRRKFGKIVLNFWGSDILRSSKTKRLLYSPLVHAADVLSFTGETTFESFLSYKSFCKQKEKCVIRGMGIPLVGDIGMLRNCSIQEKNKWKKQFGLALDKVIVTIGYHGRKAMQQLEAVQSLMTYESFPMDKVQFIIPSRGMSSEHREKILNCFRIRNASFKFFDVFIPDDEMAKFRLITDIFINPQQTDVASGSMIENVCAGAIVFNASWLNYPNLDKKNIYYKKFDDFESLPILLSKNLENFQLEKSKCQQNYDKYAPFLIWENKTPSWLELYDIKK